MLASGDRDFDDIIKKQIMITTMNSAATPVPQIVLDRVECYDASTTDCYAFRRNTDIIDGIRLAVGNMVSGFPFDINGIHFNNSEAAYICGLFSNNNTRHLDIQSQLQANTNGLAAKRLIRRRNADCQRQDWEEFNIEWMKYVVWQKTIGNADFPRLLTSIPLTATIIEDSTFQNGRTAEIWGTRNLRQKELTMEFKKSRLAEGLGKCQIKRMVDAKRLGEWRQQGYFRDKNIMGKILMMCRDAVSHGVELDIDYALLRSKEIYLGGQLLTFEQNRLAA